MRTLNQVIDWLRSHRIINLLFALAYFLFILFMHDPLVHLSLWVEKNLSLPVYNSVVAAIFILILFILLFFLQKKLRLKNENRKLQLFYLSITIAFIIIHSRFMFDSNIEVIHSFEFTFLAFLLFAFTKRFSAAIFFTLPFMIVDEWYQYIILYPQQNDYFDLNDILMDTYGCGLAMTVLFILGLKGSETIAAFWKRSEFISLLVLTTAILIAAKLCLIVPYTNETCSNTLLVINEGVTYEPFWRLHPAHNIWFHVMKPLEGLLAIFTLHFFYFGLDSFRKNRTPPLLAGSTS